MLMKSTPDAGGDWKKVLERSQTSHWFIDEFAAINAGHKELDDAITKAQRDFEEEQFLWVAIDRLQTMFETLNHFGFEISKIENSSMRQLMLIHRCTKGVFKEYQIYCSELIAMGHQNEVKCHDFTYSEGKTDN
jgi:hypothetical protein